jgi:hypothetical protein
MFESYVRSIVEAAVKPIQAAQYGLALCKKQGSITLYDPAALLRDPTSSLPNIGESYSRIVMAHLKYVTKTVGGEKLNEVKSAAAKHGYGPVIYDALLNTGWTMPDRLSVSHEALRVWKYYANKRGDVSMKPLPAAFRVSDDDEYHDEELELVNSAYFLPELQPGYSELTDAHEEFVRSLKPYHTAESVEKYLSKAGDLLFGELY